MLTEGLVFGNLSDANEDTVEGKAGLFARFGVLYNDGRKLALSLKCRYHRVVDKADVVLGVELVGKPFFRP